jgi:hypothetical protein
VLVDAAHRTAVGFGAAQLVEHAHLRQHAQVRRAAEVDGKAAGAQRGRDLDDGGRGAVPGQPVGQGWPDDARAGDEDAHPAQWTVGHRSASQDSGKH